MGNLFAPPAKASLPLALGGDLYCVLKYRQADGYGDIVEADWPDGATVVLHIEPDLDIDADITGPTATVHEQSEIVDAIKSGTRWRLIMTVGDLDRVLINGTVVRKDG